MKNLKKIVIIFILLIGSPKVISQENTLTEIAIINQNVDYKLTATISQNQTNNAIITQIGNQNHNQNTIIANQSIIQVYQNGHFNLTDIYRVENEVNEYIIQNGSGNSINEMSIGNYNTIDNQYIQNGNNNRITSFGSNSISENLKIQINGNNTAIIVISQ